MEPEQPHDHTVVEAIPPPPTKTAPKKKKKKGGKKKNGRGYAGLLPEDQQAKLQAAEKERRQQRTTEDASADAGAVALVVRYRPPTVRDTPTNKQLQQERAALRASLDSLKDTYLEVFLSTEVTSTLDTLDSYDEMDQKRVAEAGVAKERDPSQPRRLPPPRSSEEGPRNGAAREAGYDRFFQHGTLTDHVTKICFYHPDASEALGMVPNSTKLKELQIRANSIREADEAAR
jgi:hypothetical protein